MYSMKLAIRKVVLFVVLLLVVLFFASGDAKAIFQTPSQNMNHHNAITSVSIPYLESFESGVLGPEWTVVTTGNGRVRISDIYAVPEGDYAMLLDSTSDYAISGAYFVTDLSGITQPTLSFYWREYSDETHDEDGIFLSVDGTTWHRILDGDVAPNTDWDAVSLDLLSQASGVGLTITGDLWIKFQFYDNFAITSDGYGYDFIQVTDGLPTWPPAFLEMEYTTPVEVNVSNTYSATVETGTGVTYDWNFGDGSTDQGQFVNYAYTIPDTYTVTVTAASGGYSNTTSEVVEAQASEAITGLQVLGGSVTLGQTSRFTPSSATGNFLDYEWKFADGTIGSGEMLEKSFPTGVYTVALTASNLVYNVQSTKTFTMTTPFVFVEQPVVSTGGWYNDFYLADLDDDTDVDIYELNTSTDKQQWWENDGSGVFSAHTIVDPFTFSNIYPPVDLDSDNNLDLITYDYSDWVVFWTNDGSGNFTPTNQFQYASTLVSKVSAADFDGDNDLDLCAGDFSDNVLYFENLDPGWTTHVVAKYDDPMEVLPYDMDNDGDQDLLVVSNDDYDVGWFENNGIITSTINWSYNSIDTWNYKVSTAKAADFDGDGDLDVIASGSVTEIYENQDGVFVPVYSNGDLEIGTHSYPVDVDGDGDLDLVGNEGENILWLENRGDFSFIWHSLNIFEGESVSSQAMADLDNDGDLDMVVSAKYGLSWWQMVAAAPASLPYNQGFESKHLDTAWINNFEADDILFSTSAGAGTQSINLDKISGHVAGREDFAELTLFVDLSGVSQAELGFLWKEEANTDASPTEGVSISDDGASWHQVLSTTHATTTWTPVSIDLDQTAAEAGMSFNDHFMIRFSTNNEGGADSYGYFYDEVRVEESLYWEIIGLEAIATPLVELGSTTYFTATVLAGTDVAFDWDFGDSHTDSGAIASHIYAAPGFYTATITATNSVSAESEQVVVEVQAPEAIAGLSAGTDKSSIFTSETSFNATVTAGNFISYSWDFGDGYSEVGQQVKHIYPAIGVYTATVTAVNSASSFIDDVVVTITERPACTSHYFDMLPYVHANKDQWYYMPMKVNYDRYVNYYWAEYDVKAQLPSGSFFFEDQLILTGVGLNCTVVAGTTYSTFYCPNTGVAFTSNTDSLGETLTLSAKDVDFDGEGIWIGDGHLYRCEGPEFSVDDVVVVETSGGAEAVFTVSLRQVYNHDLSVDVYTEAGTAIPSVDYTHLVTTTLDFPVGTVLVEVRIPVLPDDDADSGETFDLRLTNAVNLDYTGSYSQLQQGFLPQIGDSRGTATIQDEGSNQCFIYLPLIIR